ncbi:hypothetical protein [Microcoleus sp. D3_18a_C4]|uniref:hypothetical protein n=1 Tax=unclassified Microcoleus TaxID=2642155 RepID=UPI002FD089EC
MNVSPRFDRAVYFRSRMASGSRSRMASKNPTQFGAGPRGSKFSIAVGDRF